MPGTAEQPDESWDPFGRPIFDGSALKALERVGVVDVGSNSVRLVVFDGAARSPAYFYNEKIMCGLGAGMATSGRLNPEGRVRALQAMKRFHLLAESMKVMPLTVVATAAVRDASDGPEFCADVKRETGLTVQVIDGLEEARLSAGGVLLGWPGSYGLVCDIGGSSMELAEIHGGRVGRRVTSDLGPLKLRDMKGGKKARRTHIRNVMQNLAEQMGEQHNRLFLVGGSWRAIARIDMERRNYPMHVLHEYRMTARDVTRTAKFMREQNLDDLRIACGLSASRIDLTSSAAEVLSQVVRTFGPRDIAISAYGIREGLLYEQMPQILRERDPLIEACYHAELRDARMPGFGKVLYKFVRPLFSQARDDQKRLIKAACLLHDVSWRAHPDYRAEVCFDNATRANLGGLKHGERVFLGLALLHRYRNKREGTRFEPLSGLISEKAQTDAEILGKAMRLGAMLWVNENETFPKLALRPRKRILELTLAKDTEPLFGEVAQARLSSLASSLGTTYVVKTLPNGA